MRRLSMLVVLTCLAAACGDDDEKQIVGDGGTDAAAPGDASTPDASNPPSDGAVPDAAQGDGGVQASRLPRPGALERPPTSLPASLKPPR